MGTPKHKDVKLLTSLTNSIFKNTSFNIQWHSPGIMTIILCGYKQDSSSTKISGMPFKCAFAKLFLFLTSY